MSILIQILQLITLLPGALSVSGNWEEWWTYDGISGPDFWGLLNPEWSLCNKGKRQSPIDIKPNNLLYDPFLRPIHIDDQKISGVLENNGHSVVFRLNAPDKHRHSDSSRIFNEVDQLRGTPINISSGPLSYSYSFDSLYIHFGRTDSVGSEHRIDGIPFPAELQIIGYNSDLYRNSSEASRKTNGLVGISVLIQIGDNPNLELRHLTSMVHLIRFKGQNTTVKSLSIRELIPQLETYITYEGSMTVPACSETVTWIVMNSPIFMTKQQFFSLRKMMQGDADKPKAPLGNNFRHTTQINHRVVRTNIDFKRKQGTECPSLKRNMHYQVNSRHLRT
ncbi:carbonic anhydrase-related protein 10-like [Panonychus citri]|uniref:carbonic anhydrase-related protein 10-like n=1 Tax=Panonychus citri TaxID=50023 RepID=UPI00230724CF|nr:carbonic anhydrase-related protein 10-like [Panonychus citri]